VFFKVLFSLFFGCNEPFLKYGFSSPLAILQAQRGLELKSLAIIITLTSSIFLCVLRDTMIIFLYYIQLTKPSCPPFIFLVVLNHI
jgi:hypothetical protein